VPPAVPIIFPQLSHRFHWTCSGDGNGLKKSTSTADDEMVIEARETMSAFVAGGGG
jgi:hypothetical protein